MTESPLVLAFCLGHLASTESSIDWVAVVHGHGSWRHMGYGLWVRCVMGFVAEVSARLGCGGGLMVVAQWWVVVAWRL